jgi:hypothetical protein
LGRAPAHGDHLRSEAGVRCQEAMVAVAVHARRGDESCQALEQVERGEEEDSPAVGGGAR